MRKRKNIKKHKKKKKDGTTSNSKWVAHDYQPPQDPERPIALRDQLMIVLLSGR
jgi:hypothetical protein